ncbi:hypothetical protein V2G26_013083 [Clonostachys chloroleuca]
MEVSFHFFSKLPPELRQKIWSVALVEPWSCSKFSRISRRVKIVGDLHRTVGQVCVEARAAMHRVSTYIEPFGWINFNRHLFFYRDIPFERRLMEQVDRDCDIYHHIQHLVLNPSHWKSMMESLLFISARCPSIKSLVLIGPWQDPADFPDTPEGLDIVAYEDWSPLFRLSPTEIDLESLFQDIDRGLAGNDEKGAQYRARLDYACSRCDQHCPEFEQVYKRTRIGLERAEAIVRGFRGKQPHIHFRRFDQVALAREGRHGILRMNPPRRAKSANSS